VATTTIEASGGRWGTDGGMAVRLGGGGIAGATGEWRKELERRSRTEGSKEEPGGARRRGRRTTGTRLKRGRGRSPYHVKRGSSILCSKGLPRNSTYRNAAQV
jgi:hypothetical protein